MVAIDIDKPETCADCPFTGIEGDKMVCLLTEKTIGCHDQVDGRCPLIECGELPLDQLPFAPQQEEKE